MAYNTTTSQKQQAAARDTAIKLKREATLRNAILASYFLPLARDFQKTYTTTGAMPVMAEHNQNLNKVLNRNYRGTANRFLGQVRSSLGKPVNADEIDSQVKSTSAVHQVMYVHTSGQQIANTTQDHMHKAVRDVVVAAAAAGVVLSRRQTAKQARDQFMESSRGRLSTIGATQTQSAAEGAKYDEMNTLLRNNAVFPRAGVNLARDKVEKTWVAILDSRTRAAHVEADMQVVPFREPYTVGGQSLMRPLDTSLGATADNIVNCRCASVKSIKRVR